MKSKGGKKSEKEISRGANLELRKHKNLACLVKKGGSTLPAQAEKRQLAYRSCQGKKETRSFGWGGGYSAEKKRSEVNCRGW